MPRSSLVINLINDRPTLIGLTTYLILITWFAQTWFWLVPLIFTSLAFVGTALVERYFSTHRPMHVTARELSPHHRPIMVKVTGDWKPVETLFSSSNSTTVESTDDFSTKHGHSQARETIIPVTCVKARVTITCAWLEGWAHHHAELQFTMVPRTMENDAASTVEWMLWTRRWWDLYFLPRIESLQPPCWHIRKHYLEIPHSDLDVGMTDSLDSIDKEDPQVILTVTLHARYPLVLAGINSRKDAKLHLERHVNSALLIPLRENIIIPSPSSLQPPMTPSGADEENPDEQVEMDVNDSSMDNNITDLRVTSENKENNTVKKPKDSTITHVNGSIAENSTVQEVQAYIKEALDIISEMTVTRHDWPHQGNK